ncbi:hypothetical protein SNEBB_005725 [Seison nebaliae]|nr:hypothetical protein SNEBB_005725 [Seison nebaliae]
MGCGNGRLYPGDMANYSSKSQIKSSRMDMKNQDASWTWTYNVSLGNAHKSRQLLPVPQLVDEYPICDYGSLSNEEDEQKKTLLKKHLKSHGDTLFCDDSFDCDYRTLSADLFREPADKIDWLRPCELVEEPKLMLKEGNVNNVSQGELGDCWFVSSCVALEKENVLVGRVLPSNQPLYGDKYKGIIGVRFWDYDEWKTVFIDDRLPCRLGKLLYARCANEDEFWISLIEKAYAKLNRSYFALEGGIPSSAFVNLTGGIVETYNIRKHNMNLLRTMIKSMKSHSFITCSRTGFPDNNDYNNDNSNKPSQNNIIRQANGLVINHAYALIDIRFMKHDFGEEYLIRIKNPWADHTEWKGAWGDHDSNWEWINELQREQIRRTESKCNFGEFWMTYRDFIAHFSQITICSLPPNFFGNNDPRKIHGFLRMCRGSWIEGKNAGGCRNDIRSFSTNPKIVVELTEDPKENDHLTSYSMIVSLTQYQPTFTRGKKKNLFQIGFIIYKVTKEYLERLDAEYFNHLNFIADSGNYVDVKEISGRYEFFPGLYCIIPCTFHVNCETNFWLRIFSNNDFRVVHVSG